MKFIALLLLPLTACAQGVMLQSGGSVFTVYPPWVPYTINSPTEYLRQTSSGGTTQITVNDAVLNHSTTSTQVSDWQCGLSLPLTVAGQAWSSSDVTKATVNVQGYVTWVANGSVNISLAFGPYAVSQPITLSTTGGTSSNTFNSWVSGSLGANASSQIETAITGITTYAGIQIYSTQNYGSLTFVRNTSCWAYGLTGMPSIAVGYSTGSGAGTGIGYTAIAPDVVMSCWHASSGNDANTTLYFVDASNNLVTTKITPGTEVEVGSSDIRLMKVSPVLPSSIAPMKFAPATLTSSYLPGYTWGVPLFCVTGGMVAVPVSWNNTTLSGGNYYAYFSPLRDTGGNNVWQILSNNNLNYGAPPNNGFIPGDSGHVVAADINGELTVVMTGLFSPFNAPAGYATITAINAAMAASPISSAHSVTVKDLSAFPTY